ncbi:unnamed protein product [Callosobruchus maculatus]|uniref:Uncharacterized protein n=1 Tax=Callosobruchus maculatus TaxID=64391 RepID=A0A653DPT3_CALMS|nr:unnamed protein product [Callosobruchus maculatus]
MGPQDTPDVMDDEDHQISSEIYEEVDYSSPRKPTFNPCLVYDDSLTDAFMSTVCKLLGPSGARSIYVALEKRYVFTIADCDSVAPCYEYFLQCLKQAKGIKSEEVALDFPQCFRYDRVKELVMWKLSKA